MGHPDEQDDTEEILQELTVFGEKFPEQSRRLLAALQRLWAAPSVPEKARAIRDSQPLLKQLAESHSELARLTDLLERYERASRQVDRVRQKVTELNRDLATAKHEFLEAALEEAAARRSPTLQEVLDAHEGPVVLDVSDLRPAWEGEGDGMELLRDLLEMRQADRARERAREA